MSVPYAPIPFATAAVNPAVGGAGVPVTYVSNSQYAFAPTAMDVADLVPNGSNQQQAESLAGVLGRASAWADRYCFGADPAAKGASLAATISVEAAYLRPLGGSLRLACDYKPIVSVVGVDVGFGPTSVQSIGPSAAASLRFGRRTIYVPACDLPAFTGRVPFPQTPKVYVVWSYVNGYPHTSLAATVSEGATVLPVAATDGGSTVLGVVPGTRLTIVDGAFTETVTVTAVNGTSLTVTALANTHTLPDSPDFLPVTAMPQDVAQAVIFLATALIKTRGDNSLVLDEITEPRQIRPSAGDEFSDVGMARQLLAPYRVRIKSGR